MEKQMKQRMDELGLKSIIGDFKTIARILSKDFIREGFENEDICKYLQELIKEAVK